MLTCFPPRFFYVVGLSWVLLSMQLCGQKSVSKACQKLFLNRIR